MSESDIYEQLGRIEGKQDEQRELLRETLAELKRRPCDVHEHRIAKLEEQGKPPPAREVSDPYVEDTKRIKLSEMRSKARAAAVKRWLSIAAIVGSLIAGAGITTALRCEPSRAAHAPRDAGQGAGAAAKR